jgi:anaerobic magnesium-protoporphyrin IX monomethyl ester cyclase
MANFLLINPSYLQTYGSNQAGLANPVYPVLGLATIAGEARRAGHAVEILDLSYRRYDPEWLKNYVREGKFTHVGISATTPLVNQMRDMSFLLKELDSNIQVFGGGAHPSSLPVETMKESKLDAIVVGEGDITIVELLSGRDYADIDGICWRDGDNIILNERRPLLENLDLLAIPAWDLYPIELYAGKISKIISKYPPITTIEFSRGCVFKCDFCGSKNTMGLGYRKKSPERCADELEYLDNLGYREALLADDIFTSDNKWAIEVCQAIIKRKLRIRWTCTNGIRVDSANIELFKTMKRAGCYRVHFGFESGNEKVLKAFGKGGKATLSQGIDAVDMARDAGLETWGMFMFGLSQDTPESMKDTIAYAKRVKVDVMKFGITVPFPGTPMFDILRRIGAIKHFNWDDYNVYNDANSIMTHPNLTWEVIKEHYHSAYVQCYYLNPRYIFRRVARAIKSGELLWDFYYFFKFGILLWGRVKPLEREAYAYEDKWRLLSIEPSKIGYYTPPSARKSNVIPVRSVV